MKSKFILKLTLALMTQGTAAGVISHKTWTNPECAVNANCEVRSMKLTIDKNNNGRLAGNFMSAEFETTTRSQLKNYAFVQHIRGCIVEKSSKGGSRMVTREFFKKKGHPFKHTTWELDSASDKDPIYWSNENAGYDEMRGFEIPRHSTYVSDNTITTETYRTWAGKDKNLKANRLHIGDVPSMGSYRLADDMSLIATNINLEFRVCLHRISDIPVSVENPATMIPNAIICMDWDSIYNYDNATRKMKEGRTIDPVCLQ